MERQTGAVLHGLFTLSDGVSEQEFLPAFESFYRHLHEKGYVCGYHLMRRQPLEDFGAPLPSLDYSIAIEFPSLPISSLGRLYLKDDQCSRTPCSSEAVE
jgi:hypothetical protein